jgi:hypothetical protein
MALSAASNYGRKSCSSGTVLSEKEKILKKKSG